MQVCLKHLFSISTLAHSLSEMIRYVLSNDDVKFVLTERFNQDPIEIFFAQQRARGQRNDNPSVSQFLENTQALMVQRSLAMGSSSSIREKRHLIYHHFVSHYQNVHVKEALNLHRQI